MQCKSIEIGHLQLSFPLPVCIGFQNHSAKIYATISIAQECVRTDLAEISNFVGLT